MKNMTEARAVDRSITHVHLQMSTKTAQRISWRNLLKIACAVCYMMNSCAFPNQLHDFSFFDIICSVNVTEKKSQHARLRYRQIFELSNGLRKNRIIFSKSNRPCLLFCLPNFSIKVSSSRFRSGLLTNLHSDISTKCRILLLQISLFTVISWTLVHVRVTGYFLYSNVLFSFLDTHDTAPEVRFTSPSRHTHAIFKAVNIIMVYLLV